VVINMAGMGPPPKPDGQRRRRNATVAMTRLPAEGRSGTAPRWPLGEDIETAARLKVARAKVELLLAEQADGRDVDEAKLTRLQERVAVLEHVVAIQTKAERAIWRELWRTPMAAAWERLRYTREVAQYVRWKVHAENGNLDAAKEARQIGDRIGLTNLAMLRLRWEIAADEVGQARQAGQAEAAPARKLRAVDPAAGQTGNAAAGSTGG
jgi:hypothetical protein